MGHSRRARVHSSGNRLVTALTRSRYELARALVTEKIVARQDVVDLQALGACEALAHVALKQALVTNDGITFAVRELSGLCWTAARLAVGRGLHERAKKV